MSPGQAALTFVSLLVIVDPVALAPVFGALTRDMAPAAARRTALVATLAGFALLGLAGVAGHVVVRALGREAALAHLVVAVALAAMGALMLAGRGGPGGLGAGGGRDPALVPLAAPLIAGPGALAAMAMFASKYAGQDGALATLYGLLAAVGGLTWAAFRASGPIVRRLGDRGVRLITRALGLVLIGAAARFAYEALRDYGLIGATGHAS